MDELPIIAFASQDDWAGWLADHHATSTGVWLKMAKAGTGTPTVTYAEAVEAALCYGWIDGQRKRVDDAWFVQRFTPRRPRSPWSKINTEKATALIKAGRMKPAGLREVERAKADGRWAAAYAGPATIETPDDLATALARNRKAKAFFETLDSRNRYAVLYRVGSAKRPETRAKRIAQFVDMLAKGEKLN